MSLNQPEIVDGTGFGILRKGERPSFMMFVYDREQWGDQDHIQRLKAKIAAYVEIAQSGRLVTDYPMANGSPIRMILWWQHEPDEDGLRFLTSTAELLSQAGIGFDHEAMPAGL